jgi:RNA polymerase sigma factor (TIGR02999 family)
MTDPSDATQILIEHVSGDLQAADRLLPLIHTELKHLAVRYLRGERAAHTLQPTALVNEAYLRLIRHERMNWQGKTHFFAMAAKTMRRVLVDHAQSHAARKRGGDRQRVTLTDRIDGTDDNPFDVLALHDALNRLTSLHDRQGQVVELRFFGGLTEKEVAQVLEVSTRTVQNDWRTARAWLLIEMEDDPP